VVSSWPDDGKLAAAAAKAQMVGSLWNPGALPEFDFEIGGTMLKVVGPMIDSDQVTRQLECQREMQEKLTVLIGLAERAGWSWHEIAVALMELTEEYAVDMHSAMVCARQAAKFARAKTLH
jgi:hypothetical protein